MDLVTDRPVSGSSPVDSQAVEALMDRAHAAGVTGVRYALDSVVSVNGAGARFTAMPNARAHRRRGAFYMADRDADRRQFNDRFSSSVLTEADARRELRALKAAVPVGYRDYAPIDFGGGLRIGQIASTDSGTGRWDFFNGRIVGPLVAGKRVLDLGCNNGSLPLMMLRAGAREIVAVEYSPPIADFARLNARILSWRDVCAYRFKVLTGDMRMFLTEDLGHFDVVTAFCSLYYLPEADMARIIAKASGMGATLVLQANNAIDNLPASVDRLRSLMAGNGYSRIDIFAPQGFARPLLVGAPPGGRSV
jgi:SAM-dependent methyltransferase